jgi:DNA-binding protein HU-beta
MATKNTPTSGKSTKAEPKSSTAKAAPAKAAASKEKATTTKAANVNPAPKATTKTTESKATETNVKESAAPVAIKEPVTEPKTKQENLSATAAKKETTEKRQITAEHIAIRAYLLWQERGFNHGSDVNDWLRAEAELNSLN